MKTTANIFWWLYLLLSSFHLLGEVSESSSVYLTKPLLMPTLAIAFWLSSGRAIRGLNGKVILALVFAMGGDVFLMLEGMSAQYAHLFLFGVGSFLITHLLYMLIFNKIANSNWKYLFRHPLWIVIAVIFLVTMLSYLWPDLPPGLNIAVLIYSTCIVMMALMAVNASPNFSPTAFRILIFGVLCFVLSDSVIALNKFKSAQLSIPFARLIIMFLYLLGQGLIVKGLLMYLNDSAGSPSASNSSGF